MKYLPFLILSLISFSGYLFADNHLYEYPEPEFIEEVSTSNSFWAKVIMWVISIQLCLRGIAEGLTKFAATTENKWDDGAAKFLSKLAWSLGWIIGKLGYGAPTEVTKREAKKLS